MARYCDRLISEVKSGNRVWRKSSAHDEAAGDLIAAEKVITWTVASNCLMMQWARGKRNQWTVKMCAVYAIYTGCYQATHQTKQKRWRCIIKVHNFIWHNFWIIILSKTLGSSSSMILINNCMDHRKTKGLSYEQMLSELDTIKIYGYPSQQDHKAWCCQVERMICY